MVATGITDHEDHGYGTEGERHTEPVGEDGVRVECQGVHGYPGTLPRVPELYEVRPDDKGVEETEVGGNPLDKGLDFTSDPREVDREDFYMKGTATEEGSQNPMDRYLEESVSDGSTSSSVTDVEG